MVGNVGKSFGPVNHRLSSCESKKIRLDGGNAYIFYLKNGSSLKKVLSDYSRGFLKFSPEASRLRLQLYRLLALKSCHFPKRAFLHA